MMFSEREPHVVDDAGTATARHDAGSEVDRLEEGQRVKEENRDLASEPVVRQLRGSKTVLLSILASRGRNRSETP